MNAKCKSLLICGVASAVSATICLWRLGAGTVARESSHENAQVLEKSERIYRQIVGRNEKFTTSVVRFPTHWNHGRTVFGRQWVLMSNDAHDETVAVEWRTDNGDMIGVSSKCHADFDITSPALGKLAAAQWTLHWLKALGVASTAPMWRLAADPKNTRYGAYVARWLEQDREVTITIHSKTGELSSLRVRNIPTI